jgi:hypothetical protein
MTTWQYLRDNLTSARHGLAARMNARHCGDAAPRRAHAANFLMKFPVAAPKVPVTWKYFAVDLTEENVAGSGCSAAISD